MRSPDVCSCAFRVGAHVVSVIVSVVSGLLAAEQVYETSADVEITGSFEAMGLKEDLLRGIYAYGFQNPSAIQQRAIIPMIAGRDVIAQSQSGTGKSTIFCIGILQVWRCVRVCLWASVCVSVRVGGSV